MARQCSVPGCDHDRVAKGLCDMHWKRNKKHGDPTVGAKIIPPKTCTVPGCEAKHHAKGYCRKHHGRRRSDKPGFDVLKDFHGKTNRGKVDGVYLKSREYSTWQSMKQRCYNPNNRWYKAYGGRGITICDEWRESFMAFYRDMGDKPEGMSIDRIDNDGNYEPGNCRWTTQKVQRNNQRKKEGTMATLVENIDKEIKKAKEARKQLDNDIKELEIAKVALKRLGSKKTTKAVKASKKAEKVATDIQDGIRAFVGGQE